MFDKIVTILGITLGVLPWLFDKVGISWKIVLTLIVISTALLCLCIYYMINNQHLQRKTDPFSCFQLQNMRLAFQELLKLKVKKIYVLSYIGNFTLRSMVDYHPDDALDDVELRILLRDPNKPWNHPPDASKQKIRRVEEINSVMNSFNEHQKFRKMKHRLMKLPFLRYISDSEPQIRVLLGECIDGKRYLYLGFYSLGERADHVFDFSGTDRPVIRISDTTSQRNPLIDDFVEWYDFMWKLKGTLESKEALANV